MNSTIILSFAIGILSWSATTTAQTNLPSNADICRADVNQNGVVDSADVSIVRAAYRTKLGYTNYNPAVDFNGDHAITLSDLTFVTTRVGRQCLAPPPPPPPVAPVVAITAPATGLLTNAPHQTITGTVSDTSLMSAILKLNGVDQALVLSNGQFSQPIPLAEGQNRLVASASNAGGPGVSSELLITLDTLGPTLTARMPVSVAPGSAVSVLAEALDSSGVSSVSLQVDGGPSEAAATAPYLFSFPVPGNAVPGTLRRLQFRARDRLGNERTIDRAVVVEGSPDTTPPSVLLTSPETATPGEIIPVTASAADDQSLRQLTLTQGATPLGQLTSAPFAVQHAFTIPEDAQVGQVVEFAATAGDGAGNVGAAQASVRIVSTTSEVPALRLSVDPVASPTFLPSQVITGTVNPTELQTQHQPRPFIASLALTEGRQGERLHVHVRGANSSFAPGVSEATFGPGITINGVEVQ